jgi:hypothetical protein
MPAWQRQPRMGGTFTRLKMWTQTPSSLPASMKLTPGVEKQRCALSPKARIPTSRRAGVRNCRFSQGCFRTLERLESRSTLLGLFEKWDCSFEERQLFPGDTFLCTDGATESVSDAGEEFRERRLVQAFRRHGGQPSASLLVLAVEEIRQFDPSEQQDDLTLIVAHSRGDVAPA